MFGVIDIPDDNPAADVIVPQIKNKLNPISLSKQVLIECIEDNYDTLRDDAGEVCRLFDSIYKPWPLEFSQGMIKKTLEYINGKLESHYGVKIKSDGMNGELYRLKDLIGEHFNFNENGKLIPKF
jgi:hypothetical protein